VHKSKLRRISLAVCFALMPFAAEAAGLGKLTVISGLGEPLSAEIELLSTSPEELSSLSAAIAPEDAYAVQGIERLALHSAIKIEVAKKANGTPILKLSTRQPVNDPFLDMLIQVDWSTGRLLREYTVLLDPPGYSSQMANNNAAIGSGSTGASTRMAPIERDTSSAGQSASGVTKKSKRSDARSPSKKATSSATPVEQNPSPSAGSSPTSNAEEHTTVRGDTLNAIASDMKVEGVSLEQMLVGLYRANKNAFVGNNMNRLKVGQILRAPSPEDLQSINRKEAAQEIRVQTADWNAYRNKLAGLVAESPAGSESASAQSSGGKITAPAEDKAAPVSNGPRDVVKLSKSDSATNKNGGADGKAMQDKLNSLQEEATAREKSVKEANERTALLEKQVADMQKLLAVKNQAMADMQKNAAAPASTPVPAPKAEPAPKPEAAPEAAKQAAAGAAVVPPPASPAPDAQAAAPKPETPATEAPATADKPVAPKKKIIIPPPAPVAEPDLLDQVLQDPVLLGGAGGILVVLLGGTWLFLRNKRKRGLDSFEKGILTSGGLKANTVFGNTSGGTVDTGDTSFLTDFSQSSSAGMIDTHDVDPIAEAEVYMAYGRDAQAEEILKDAIAKEPKRYELHLKLLEILAGRKDSSAFETIAGEMYSTLGSSDPVWIKVAEIGRKMEPNNPLYDVSTSHGAATPSASSQKLNADDFANAEVMSESSLDFSLDADTQSKPSTGAPESAEQDSALDFDLGAQESAAAEEALPEISRFESGQTLASTLNSDNNQTSNDLDFQLDLPKQSTESDKTIQLDESGFGNTLPGFDMPEFDIAPTSPAAGEIPAASVAEPSFESSLPEISFDLPEIGSAKPTVEVNRPEDTAALKLPDFDEPPKMESDATTNEIVFESPSEAPAPLEFSSLDQTTILESDLNPEEIVFKSVPEESGGLDFNFDMDLGASEAVAQTPEEAEVGKVPELDLSGISLDFDSAPDQSTVAAEAKEFGAATGESADVDTKLDLVTAYMDMGDNEGARELLDEVLKEGGPKQRERAQQMMNSLG
jgi:pilus assembly protein FimV